MQEGLQKRLLLATNNPGKLHELRAILARLEGVELVSPEEAGLVEEVQEAGQSYAENAALKARAYAQASGLVTLADDSGLEVDALGGEPGLHSKRYSPKPEATDADRRKLLLENLKGKPRPWRARFRATICVALPDGEVYFREGVCEGEIIPEERGTGGFGYDPIFLVEGTGRTMAELSEEEKNRVSHRGRGVREAEPILFRVLKEN